MQTQDDPNERISHPHAFSPVQQAESAEEELDLRQLFMKLYRHRMVIAGIFLLVVAVNWLNLSRAVPLYTATARMVLEFRKATPLMNVDDVGGYAWVSPDVIGTEIDIIRSASLLERVVDHLGLANRPEFNPALRPKVEPSQLQVFMAELKGWIKGLWPAASAVGEGAGETSAAPPSPEEAAQRFKSSLVARLMGGLQVENNRNTYTLSIAYTSENPQLAAQLANAVAEMYIDDQLESKFEATRRANEWLVQRLEGLRQDVKAAEQAVKNLRQQSDMIPARGGTLLEQQIGDVNAQLIQARLKKSRSEAKLSQARDLMSSPGGIETLGQVLDAENIQKLRAEETALRRKKADLSQRYGPRHPEMIQVDAEIRDLQEKFKEESARVLKSFENEVQVARAEEQSLLKSLNLLKADAGQAMQTELQLRELERQAQSSRTLYESYLVRFQANREKDDLQRPNARIISPAEVPSGPSYPRKSRTLMIGIAVGLMLGVMAAFLLEALDRGFRTGDQIEHETGLPILGSFPLLSRRQGTPLAYVKKKPYSSMAEALRAFLTAIQLSNVDRPPKTVMVTSALPREGKSMFSLAAGRMAAAAGGKVLVIDADVRRPVHHKRFPDLAPQARLEDVLQGQAKLEEAIVKDPESGMCLLMAHGNAAAVRDMLGSRRMRQLLEKLKEVFDLIILDTPPFMGVSDAWGLARHVDAVIFLVRWAETPRDTVKAALRQMQQLEIEVDGIVMSMVNVRQQSRYGYGGYGYYYGKYQKYYKD